MESTVKVENVFRLTIRKKMVLAVSIIKGEIKSGMKIQTINYSRTIDSLDFIDAETTTIGLVFNVNDSDYSFFDKIKIGDLLIVK
ncbi:hypothetical protein [Spirosoma jeollabukense]